MVCTDLGSIFFKKKKEKKKATVTFSRSTRASFVGGSTLWTSRPQNFWPPDLVEPPALLALQRVCSSWLSHYGTEDSKSRSHVLILRVT